MKGKLFCMLALALLLGAGGFGVTGVPQAFAQDVVEQPVQLAGAVAPLVTQDVAGKTSSQSAVKAASAKKASKATPAKPTKKQLKAFKKASADFAIDLFKRSVMAKGKNANVTIAPMSVMSALSLTANGARGKTLAQMCKVLGDGASMARINKNLAWYNSKLVNAKKARLRSANSVWYHNDGSLTMKKGFLAKARKYYAAEVSGADFNDPGAVKTINGWVAKNTNNMIKKIVDRLKASDRIAILNALYFDAEWRTPFEPSNVTTQRFTNANGKKRKVKMMHGTEYSYIEREGVTGFIKPYAKGYSYVALLPKKGMNARQFAKGLTGDSFRKLVSGAKQATVLVALPKYTISYSNDSMEKQLKVMGMKLPFSSAANFKSMATCSDGDLSVDRVVHKTKIEVDEQGTRAAAVTGVMMKANSAFLGDVKRVTLNRPFVYAIVDNATKLPVFIGTVSNIGK